MRRPNGSGLIRSNCLVEGCVHIQKHHGRTKGGKKRYSPYCGFHCISKNRNIKEIPSNWFKNNVLKKYWKGRQTIDNGPCAICGWNKGPCDRHRLKPEKGYIEDNIQLVCPNHHRLISLGIPF